ncbi:MAG: GNAT family N-acetyltransferase [archaeon]|jgi:ribosomal protein S18 acetylase RimI-like enzyme
MKLKILLKKQKNAYWAEIKKFWEIIDNEFVPPLSTRGDSVKLKIRDTDKSEIIVAEENNILKGIVVYWIYYPPVKTAYLHWLIVKPEFRGRGIGTKLMKKAISRLKGHGVKIIKLVTYSTKVSALNIYYSLGFKLYYTKRNLKGPGIHKVYLKLNV